MTQTKASNTSSLATQGSDEANQIEANQVLDNLHTWGFWERVTPEHMAQDSASQAMLEMHLQRYQTASRFIQGKKVLDIASGSGFGTRMLKDAGAEYVVGVDISPESLAYAQAHYQTSGIEFIQSDAQAFQWHEPFDVVITFETVEHVPDPVGFLASLRRLIAPEGELFLSVPLGETRHLDPYHLHAFSQADLFQLVEAAGFELQAYRCDHWSFNSIDMLRWWWHYPAQRMPLNKLFTKQGLRAAWDVYKPGGLQIEELLLHAKPTSSSLPKPRKTLQSLI